MRWLTMLLTGLLVAVLGAPAVHAKDLPTCKNPRDAADSVFTWQLGPKESQSIANAARCLDKEGRTRPQLLETARRIKAVYDAEGAFVEMDSISDDPEFTNERKQHSVVVHPDLPEVKIVEKGDRWVWSKQSLDWIDQHYEENLSGLDAVLVRLPVVLTHKAFGLFFWQYLALLILVGAGWLVGKVIRAVVAPRLDKWAKKLGKNWPNRVLDVIAAPGSIVSTAAILRMGYPQLRLPIEVSSAMSSVVRVLITISIVWAIYRSVEVLTAFLEDRAEGTESRLDDQLVPLLRKTLKVVVCVIGALVVLQNLKFDVTTLVANLSIGTLALGLAAKDTLANLFGSVSIFADTPFQLGDWIHVDGTHGTVEEVGLRSTRIRTFYDSVVVMPNAKLADAKIDNYGERTYRRCLVTLGLTYDTTPEQMQAFVEGIRAIIAANEYTRKDLYEVQMSGFGDSALEVMVFFFFHCDSWGVEMRERHNVFLEFMRLARDLGVSFAFPTQSLHIEAMPKVGPRELPDPMSAEELGSIVDAYGPKGDRARPSGPKITKGWYADAKPDRGEDAAEAG